MSATEAAPGQFDLLFDAADDDGGAGVRDLALYSAVGDSAFRPLETAIGGSSVPFVVDTGGTYRFFSVATDHAGNVEAAKDAAEVVVSNEEEQGREIPESFALYQNYPNPFNPTTTIPFDISESSEVEIKVFDVIGRLVRQYKLGDLHPGKYEHRINMVSIASGVYFYELRASGSKGLVFRDVRTVVLVR